MSNDLILSIKNSLPAVVGEDDDTFAIARRGSGATNKRISIKGGVFRKYSGGKEVGAIEDRHMDVIFVKMAHNASRSFYEKAYVEGEKASPTCWSTDGRTPDPEVKAPVASACNSCPMSVKGSSSTGTTSACRLSWRTAVVLPNDPSGDVMQLIIPGKSCFHQEIDNGRRSFLPYINWIAGENIRASRIVTRMSFDTKSPVPKLLFSPVSALPANIHSIIDAQSKTPAAENAVKLTVFQTDEGAAPVAAPAASVLASLPQMELPLEAAAEPVPEPVLRTEKPTEKEAEVSDLVRRWGGKK